MMKMKYKVCVLTPTFNRRHLIERLFESLCRQSIQAFQWLVIDDGSTDETDEYFNNLSTQKFEINYLKKENGGKHTALNYSHPYIQGDVVVIVDSDDYLVDNAIETIENDWTKYSSNPKIGCLSYHRQLVRGGLCSASDNQDEVISDHITYRVNCGRGGDRCEVIRTECFKQFPFPVFSDEKFMSEGWLWNHIAVKYNTVYINKAIYMCDYQPDGLSAKGRRLRMDSPCGMMENSKSFIICHKTRSRIQIKETWLYWAYGLCAKKSVKFIIENAVRPIMTAVNAPFGVALFMFWNIRYGKDS